MSFHKMMNFETKQTIKQALIIQIEEVGFERVTVKNLALTANINRGTFYLHYKDKFEVMEDLQNGGFAAGVIK
ncbi:TetR/AcrR family transcriptional regulator [Lysinibacillus sp. NPDC097231]|uniref:TetR/AcrR family transcriptional regulator n=1 Tax=Lysinibacillus sp. NPDC097231 TaxID=3364142 RepID=UPI00380F9627